MKICVIGLGYIGLPSAVVLASNGHDVVGVDVKQDVVDMINAGKIHIVEPGLEEALSKLVSIGNFKATTTPTISDVYIICVPTPFMHETNIPNLSYIYSALDSIMSILKKGDLIILESTSPVGTCEGMAKYISQKRKDLVSPLNSDNPDFNIAHCPERVIPGNVLNEIVYNDRIIGGVTNLCTEKALMLYKTFVKGKCHCTNAKTAEMVKLTENISRDIQIAFANELSMLCDNAGINVWELIKLANYHPRVNILNPGCGVGGHCIAVDPWFIISSYPDNTSMMRLAREINDYKPKYVVDKIIKKFTNKEIVCLGLSFKPNIDDLRESPSIKIVKDLYDYGFSIKVVEPNIKFLPQELIGICELIDINEIYNLDNFVFLVGHDEFKNIPHILEHNYIDFCGVIDNAL